MMKTTLLVSIDTEENWEGPGEAGEPRFDNIYEIPGLQKELFDKYGIRPVYLVTYSVAADEKSVSLLSGISRDKRCEIGAHLHSWHVPPIDRQHIIDKVFQYTLPFELEKKKIEALTKIIVDRFHARPVTFRAGRWGADGDTIKILADAGYKVDASVTPLVNHMPSGGMDFMDAPFKPYYPGFDDITRPSSGDNKAVLEIPVTNGFSRKDFETLRAMYKRAMAFPKQLHAVGVLERLGIVRKLSLCPEKHGFKEMRDLVDRCLERGHKVLHLTFHSSMNLPGGSPFSRTKRERDQRIEALRDIFSYMINERGIASATAEEFSVAYGAR